MAFGISRSLTRLYFMKVVGSSLGPRSFSVATPNMAASSPEAEFASSEIANNKVVVFSKSYCPFCLATKQLLSDMDVKFKLHELDQMDNGASIQAALTDLSGQRTVPNVFINGKHVGGNDKVQAAAKSGKLSEMLAK
ncbi:hypothetical protein ACA910_000236 [Epithemia clementina (nom. ined.)]